MGIGDSNDLNWPVTVDEARIVQAGIVERVRVTPLRKKIRSVAGIDAAFTGGKTIAAVTVSGFPSLDLREERECVAETRFPYIPGYLSFREGPAMICAYERLRVKPDLIIFDGQGIAHPGRAGIASHIGVLLGKPSIGCAKSRLVGEFEEPASRKGSWNYLYYKGEAAGAVVRTRDGVKPLFISPGNLVTIEDAVELILQCTGRYRLPEPVRAADSLSRRVRDRVRDGCYSSLSVSADNP